MKLTADNLRKISKGTPPAANINSIVVALNTYGAAYGLDQPHRMAHYIAQLAHESGSFRYDQEIASGVAYEGRKDLGNTKPGDGKRYKGRGPIQITGRANYREFTKWARKTAGDAPDFEATPDAVNTDPWEGLGPVWYWDTRKLNAYADRNDIENLSVKINGRNKQTGQANGLADRMDYYTRAALVLLGFPASDLKALQEAAKKRGEYSGEVDGAGGPLSRAALHKALVRLTAKPDRAQTVQAAPIVTEKPVAVTSDELEKPAFLSAGFFERVVTGGGLTTVAGAVGGVPWQALAVMGVIALAGLAFWLYIRSRSQAQVAAKVDHIEDKQI